MVTKKGGNPTNNPLPSGRPLAPLLYFRVFRISLVEPAEVEPTVFQLKGVLGHNN